MRSLVSIVVLLAACRPNCGLPTTLDGVRFQAFGNVVDYDLGQSGAPPGETLINGHTDLEFEWDAITTGPIVVRIDDQPFEGEGSWNLVECGNFSAAFGGTFRSSDGSEHNFTAAGNFYLYDILIEGSVAWNETWTSADGSGIGSMQVRDGSIVGREYAPGQ